MFFKSYQEILMIYVDAKNIVENSVIETRGRSFVRQADLKIDSLLVTSDILRIDDRSENQFENPQRINIDWIKKLIAPVVAGSLKLDKVEALYGDEGGYRSPRWRIYSAMHLPMKGESWASVYQSVDADLMENEIFEKFDGKLTVGFELPPYLIEFLERHALPYIDFTIHPVRFLPDYMMGIRTNVMEWEAKISSCALADSVVYDFARISASRTTRIMQGKLPEAGSALFLGQLTVDASLISNGSIVGDDYLVDCLMKLSSLYPKVYFKSHPHCKFREARKKLISKIKNCEWIEINIYDALACDRFDYVTAISSGGVIESKYFGKDGEWMLPKENYFDVAAQDRCQVYWPVYQASMMTGFWEFVVSGEDEDKFQAQAPNPFEGAVKFNLNMKWGR